MVRQLRKKGQPIFILMIFLTLLISVPFQPALAALVETETVINPDSVKDTRVLLNQLMAREDVRTALLSYGINLAEADARVAAMTDDEITTVANTMKDMPAGGMDPFAAIALIFLGFALLWVVLILAGVWGGIKIQEQKEQEYSKSTPFPAPPRVGPVPSVNPDEPWTGKWKVTQGQFTGIYALKQNGNTVISTKDSNYKIDAKVYGAMIWGKFGTRQDFKATIASDFISFKGDVDSRYTVEGQKIEYAELKLKPTALRVNPSEPWTGKWKVQGSSYTSGLWALKQDGQTVLSTDESYFTVKATVAENKIEGTYTNNSNYRFSIIISPDGKLFEGYATDKEGTKPIKGVRIEQIH